jgi:hypothetical protein
MRISKRSLKTRNRLGEKPSTAVGSPAKLDVYLGRAASLSQPLVLCLAVFGYFYTVVPVYQKELLSEQIAGKEIELTKLQHQIDASKPAMNQLQLDVAKLEHQIKTLSAQKFALESKNAKLAAAKNSLANEVAVTQRSARDFSLRTYHDSFSATVLFQYVNAPDPYKIVESPSRDEIRKFLLTPYAAVSAALASGDSKFIEAASKVPKDIKDEYHRHVRNVIESRKESLSAPIDDINALFVRIQEQMAEASATSTPNERFNARKFETTNRLVSLLYESRRRESKRTQELLKSFLPPWENQSTPPSGPDQAAKEK